MEGLYTYEKDNNDIKVFFKILKSEVDEEFRLVQA